MRIAPFPILALLIAGIAAPAASIDRTSPEERVAKATAGLVPGTPTDCIDRRRAGSITGAGDRLIFRLTRTSLYINEARGGCPIGPDQILVMRSIGARMCRGDPGQLIERNTRAYAGNCILVDFVPYTAAR